jgi:hypothetical protein
VLSTIYPGALPTNTQTVTASPVPAQAGASSIVRMEWQNPGGRTGGTLARADWCRPSAPRIGRVVLFAAGHVQGSSWYQAYCSQAATSIPLALLATGCDVIALDMPAYGTQPTPQIVVIDGEELSVPYNHPYGFTDDGGPSLNRLFTDPAIWAMDYVLSQVGGRAHFVGHSGGAQSGAIICAAESRYDLVYLLQPAASNAAGSPNEFETYSQNPAAQATPDKCWAGIVRALTAVPGRRTVLWVAPEDEYDPGKEGYWRAIVDRDGGVPGVSVGWLPRCVSGASFAVNFKRDPIVGAVTPYHEITESQKNAVVADILAH